MCNFKHACQKFETKLLFLQGTYKCACCSANLFSSDHKYDSGTGWPSFYQPFATNSTKLNTDTAHGMVRSEVVCARCDAHLGKCLRFVTSTQKL